MEAEYRVKIEVDGYRCLRCGHQWIPRGKREEETEEEVPTICPRCKSPYWNKPRRAKKKK